MRVYFILFTLSLFFSSAGYTKTIENTLEVSRKNLAGHKTLYNEGWFIVTSSKDAIETARQNSISSAQAMTQALNNLASRRQDLKQKISEILEKSSSDSQKFKKTGHETSSYIKSESNKVSKVSWDISKEMYAKAYTAFTIGYLELRQRNKSDWEELKKINSDFAKRTTHTYNDREIKIIMESFYDEAEKKSNEGLWTKSLTQAKDKFNESYQESGTKSNSFMGLKSVIGGYFSALYHGIISPSGQTASQAIKKTGSVITGGVLGLIKVGGDVVFTTGLNVFYASKLGYRVISPSLEGGYLASIALVSTAATPLIYTIGNGLGTLNQVAVTTATPLVGTGEFVVASTFETAKHAALMTYDLTSSAGKTVVNTSESLVVLGYNAISALPTQTLLAAGNAAIFLAYDGPHLAIVALRGEIDGVPINQAPVGTVFDAKKIKNENIQIEILENDSDTLQKVIEAAPSDLINEKN